MSSTKYVYLFEQGRAEMKSLLGGKGANLAEMTRIGLPVPPGFTITTEACKEYYRLGRQFPGNTLDQVFQALNVLEEKTGKGFGDRDNPLLVSVRSGAPVSMPGMMDTILNLGLNDDTVEGLAALTGDERFSYDCYRRFIQMFADVVMEIEHAFFDNIIEKYKRKLGLVFDYELSAETLRAIIDEYKQLILKQAGRDFPQEVRDQLILSIKAVFDSWNNQRAIVYRQLNKIPDELGTAVNIQVMAFGNMGDDCGTGVAFTCIPPPEKKLYGEFLINAQGEDVVAGIRTPTPISHLQEELPQVYDQFVQTCNKLEQHYVICRILSLRWKRTALYTADPSGKRTASAAVRIAVEMVREGLISKEEALLRVEPNQLNQLLHRQIDPDARLEVVAKGLPASPGAGSGQVTFDADEAERLGDEGIPVVMVRSETTPDDIHGIVKAQGVLTSRGGMTSHAAVVARGMGKPCVCGCEAIKIDYANQQFTVKDQVVKKGDIISIDGLTGNVSWVRSP